MKIRWARMETPVGPVVVAWSEHAVVFLDMEAIVERQSWKTRMVREEPEARMKSSLEKRFGGVELIPASSTAGPMQKLARYFAGDVAALDAIAVNTAGTPFQEKIWKGLRRIPAGKTLTYGEIATKAGRPGAARGAGGAVGSNPIAIIIPCHRIIGANERLTGFGGGLVRKRWLLRHEGATFRDDSPKQLQLL